MKRILLAITISCLALLVGCGSEKPDPSDSKAPAETAAPPSDHQYKRALDRARDVDKSARERNDRISEEAEN
jgi:hypothetical protein